MSWPASDPRLERRYRRLLLAHSGRYRRRHGTEIVTTLMEMAGSGRSRPSAGEAWHLIASGLRQRFRLPGRPLVLVTAALVTVVTTVFGAAVGSWAGERTFAPLPPRAAAQRLIIAAVPDNDPTQELSPFRMSVAGNADWYSLSGVPTGRHPGAGPAQIAAAVRDRITAAGWRVTSFVVQPAYPHPENAEAGVNFDAAYLEATRDGLLVHGRVGYQYHNGQLELSGFSASLFAQRTTAYLPLTIAGGVVGLIVGWLLVASLSYRVRSLPASRRRATSLLTGAALVAATPPVFAVVRQAVVLAIHVNDARFPVFTLHSALRESVSVDGPPRWLFPAGTVAAAALGALAVGVALTRAASATVIASRLASADDHR
jgi:hypothetical protein